MQILERPVAEGAGRNTVGVQPALLGGARELRRRESKELEYVEREKKRKRKRKRKRVKDYGRSFRHHRLMYTQAFKRPRLLMTPFIL